VFRDSAPLAALLSFAIERRICVLAEYNRREAKLAPHSTFERHGDLFLRAVTLEYDDRRPKELKVGIFKFSGLKNVRLSGEECSEAAFKIDSAPA
jgi:hypothetical protein